MFNVQFSNGQTGPLVKFYKTMAVITLNRSECWTQRRDAEMKSQAKPSNNEEIHEVPKNSEYTYRLVGTGSPIYCMVTRSAECRCRWQHIQSIFTVTGFAVCIPYLLATYRQRLGRCSLVLHRNTDSVWLILSFLNDAVSVPEFMGLWPRMWLEDGY
jgi:hypothetical protein